MTTQLTMSISERERRYALLRSQLAERDVDVVLAVGRDGSAARADFRYLAGYGPVTPLPSYVVFPRAEVEPVFVARTANRSRIALESGWVKEIQSSWVGLDELLLDQVAQFRNGGAIGIARLENLPVPVYLGLVKRFGADALVDVADIFRATRLVKSEEEIAAAREAARIADVAYEFLADWLAPGHTDREFYGEARRIMHTEGSEYSMDLVAIDAPGVYAPIGATLGENGFVVGELTPTYLGVYNQLPFEFAFGHFRKERHETRELLREAHDAAAAAVRPGATVGEVWAAAAAVLDRPGYSCGPGQFGHDLGYDVVDGFSILRGGTAVLAERNLLVLHPIVVPDGGPRMLLGKTFLVTADGCEALNQVDPFAE